MVARFPGVRKRRVLFPRYRDTLRDKQLSLPQINTSLNPSPFIYLLQSEAHASLDHSNHNPQNLPWIKLRVGLLRKSTYSWSDETDLLREAMRTE
jgi:hypothetical protein